MTGLPNRRLLKIKAQCALDVAKRSRELPGYVGLLYMDLDLFKQLNDNNQLKHAGGDIALFQVGQRLQEVIYRESDTVAHIGGDEFVALLPGLKNPEDILVISSRIKEKIEEMPFAIGNENFPLGISIGSSIYFVDGTEINTEERFEELMQIADKRMHEDKAQRKQSR